MKKHLLWMSVFLITQTLFGQLNLELVGQLSYESNLSDIWGYQDTSGIEYALVGVNSGGTSVVSLEDPANPREIYFAPGPNTIWRDIKTWNGHSYTVNDRGGEGLQILDLSGLPDSSSITEHQYLTDWDIAHNIFIDERGYAYIFGANRGNGGVIILDLSDPKNPVEVGEFDQFYVHDGVVRNDTMYLAHILNGFFSVVEVSDPENPQLLSTAQTPRDFTHNVWVSDNGNYLYTTDERSGAWLAEYDISDLQNITELDKIKSNHSGVNSATIVHNTHFLDEYIITSYYRDGVTIHDVSQPGNMIETGHFDTSPLIGSGFNGCWGVYPYLPSGLILASDIEEGLFVLEPTYARAAYLKGIITDEETGAPIKEVEVLIEPEEKQEQSLASGLYQTGIATSGTYQVSYSKAGYYPKVFTLNLVQGQTLTKDVQLVKDERFQLDGTVLTNTGQMLNNAIVHVKTDGLDTVVITNLIGKFSIPGLFAGNYEIAVEKWGWTQDCKQQFVDNQSNIIELFVEPGYEDNFSIEKEWQTSQTASSGAWERKTIIGEEPGEPMQDSEDCFDFAFVTGSGDVDSGTVTLTSPLIDATVLTNPMLSFQVYWHNSGLFPDDDATVLIGNGSEEVNLVSITNGNTPQNEWFIYQFNVADFISLSNQMYVKVEVNDNGGLFGGNRVELGFDDFSMVSLNPNTVLENLTAENIRVYPNPIKNKVFIEGVPMHTPFELYSTIGQQIMTGNIAHTGIDVTDLSPGIYVLKIDDVSVKLVKE